MSSAGKRQADILHFLRNASAPVSGNTLSGHFLVSRQIIVRDICSLKSAGNNIISTARGYLFIPPDEVTRIFKVHHSVADTEKELKLIVDLGATVKDVFIYHRVYGEIHGPLNISSRHDIQMFCDDIKSGKSSPLSTATSGYHYHTISAKDSSVLDMVEQALSQAGFLAPLTEYEPDTLTTN